MLLFIIGFFFISIIGTILHFVYEYSCHNKIVGLFGAVNESTWEHIKIALTPTIIWSVFLGFFYGHMNNFFPAILVSLLTIIIVIPTIFYGYKLITKKSILLIDIGSFFLAVFLSQYFSYLVLNAFKIEYVFVYASVILDLVIFAFYLLATVFPPRNLIFKDPITKKYGVKGHPEEEHIKAYKKSKK